MTKWIQATPLFLIMALLATVSGPTGTVLADAAGDRAALVALYNATDGDNWANNTNWLSDEPLGDWFGVTTDVNGRVTELDLSDNSLAGDLPAELGDLANLKELELGGDYFCTDGSCQPDSPSANQLTGEIPRELANLLDLEVLGLSANRLTGEIPVWLGDLSDLEVLDLSANRLTGEIPTELGKLSNLEALSLNANRLTGEIPPELGDLSNLKLLGLFGNQLTGEIPPELGRLTNLESLYLDGNQLTGEIPPELGRLTNLLQLWLSDNRFTGCLPTTWRDVPENDFAALGLDYCEPTLPDAPTGLMTVVSDADPQVELSWIAPIFNGGAPITGYLVQSSTDGNDPWTVVFMTTGDATSYTDDGTDGNGPQFAHGEWLHYRVAAINSAGTGPFSDPRYAGGDPLVARYDDNSNGTIERNEVITAINDYLDGEAGITRAGVIRLINLYLDG